MAELADLQSTASTENQRKPTRFGPERQRADHTLVGALVAAQFIGPCHDVLLLLGCWLTFNGLGRGNVAGPVCRLHAYFLGLQDQLEAYFPAPHGPAAGIHPRTGATTQAAGWTVLA